jgi:hypothetical protein
VPDEQSRAKGATVQSEKHTYGVLDPEFGSAVRQREMVAVVAIVLGFEIEGSLHETCAARFAIEAVVDAKFIEGILEGLHPVVLGAGVFIITWF